MAEESVEQSSTRFICEKHRRGDEAPGGILYEDDLVFAGHVFGKEPAHRGWLVVEPKRHAPGLGDLTDAEACAVGRLANRLARLLMEAAHAEHVYAFIFGDGVPHLHMHLAPRYRNTPREFWGAELNRWPDAPRVKDDDMRAFVTELRQQLSRE